MSSWSSSAGHDDDLVEEAELQQRLTTFLNACIIKPQPHLNLTWDKVIGCEDAKRDLYQKIVLPHKLLELPIQYNNNDDCIPTPGDVLLEGEPGCGKTKMAYTAAVTSNSDFFCVVNCVELFSQFGIESQIFIRMLFNTAKKHKRSVIYLRNLDCFEYDCNWTVLPAKAELKHQMEFWQERYRFVQGKLESLSIIGAARSLKRLDPGILNRFEKRVVVPLPNSKQRLQMLLMFMDKARTSFYDQDWKILVENTEGFSGRRIQTICQNAITTSKVYSLSLFSSNKDSSDREETSCINLDSFSRWIPVRKKVKEQCRNVTINQSLEADSIQQQPNKNGEKIDNNISPQSVGVVKNRVSILQSSFVSCL